MISKVDTIEGLIALREANSDSGDSNILSDEQKAKTPTEAFTRTIEMVALMEDTFDERGKRL